MPEAIAVAFVEVRPLTSNFKEQTEAQVAGQLGAAPLNVQGQLQIQGLAQAKQQVAELESSLAGTGANIQIPGLTTAATQAGIITSELRQAEQLNLQQSLVPFTSTLAQAKEDVVGLSSTFQGLPQTLSTGVAAGVSQTGEAFRGATGDAQSYATTIDNTAKLSSALELGNKRLALSQSAVTGATLEETAATREDVAANEQLIRVHGRRAHLGPLAIAGVGAGVGAAVFAGVQAAQGLASALEVTDVQTATLGTNLRNFAANLLQGDLVGAFKALGDSTRAYTADQLVLLNQTPKLSSALRDLGEAANIARSAARVQQQAAQVPQFLQTALARGQASGNIDEQIKTLQRAQANAKSRIALIHEVGVDNAATNTALEQAFRQSGDISQQLSGLLSQKQEKLIAPLVEAVTRAQQGGDAQALDAALKNERTGLQGLVAKFSTRGSSLQEFQTKLRETNNRLGVISAGILSSIQAASATTAGPGLAGRISHALARQAEAAAANAKAPAAEIAALREERANLEQHIVDLQTQEKNAAAFKARLTAVDQAIEANQQAIVAEIERHQQAITQTAIGPAELKALQAEIAGDKAGEVAALQSEVNTINEELAKGIIAGKKIDLATQIALTQQVAGLTQQITGIQTSQATDTQQAADKAKAARDKRDQAIIDSIGVGEQRRQNAITLASASGSVAAEIAANTALLNFLKRLIASGLKNIADLKTRRDELRQLNTERISIFATIEGLRRQDAQAKLDEVQQKFQLDQQIAQATGNKAAEERADKAYIAWLQRQIDRSKAGSLQRKQLILELDQTKASLKALKKAAGDTSKEAQAQFAFLQSLTGFSSQLAGNTLGSGAAINLSGPGATTSPTKQPSITAPTKIPSPFETARDRSTNKIADAAVALRERGGQPPKGSQLDELIRIAKAQQRTLERIAGHGDHPEARHVRQASVHSIEVRGD